MRAPLNSSELSSTRHLTDSEIATIVYADLRNDIALVRDALQPHLNTCDHCRVRVDEARRMDTEAAQLLQALDLTSPAFEVTKVMRRARRRRWSVRRVGQYSALAASLVVCVLGAVAFALPTSSLGRVLRQMVGIERIVPVHTASTSVQSTIAPQHASGIALSLTGPLTIEFRGGMPSLLQVRYCDTALATLYVVPKSASVDLGTSTDRDHVRFAVSNNRIRVTATDAQDGFVLTLPEHTQRVYVTDDDFHPMITISSLPIDHIPNGCHAPVTIPLSH